jgi:hypothetical protein
LANFARRKKQLEALLVESRQQIADHASGKKALGEKDLKSLEEKVRAFQSKLETMEVRTILYAYV